MTSPRFWLTRENLSNLAPGENIIVQHAVDNDIYLLVAGTVAVVVNGAQVAIRSAGQHIGEMAAIEASLPRSATVTVLENAVALKLTSAAFMEIGEKFPSVWLPIAQELSKRLHQRNKTIYLPNQAPKLFVMSSSAGAQNCARTSHPTGERGIQYSLG
ncbi:Crp/Fnr family transcriptional regulator [Bradyrhizobium zhanjiangense]|uniref:Crp/Fnr family transcriptional regulator n=1 Tax=Bradyrhizobium zhanjiangense TaxID=1325107 RepID=UPI0013E8D235|nr:cyclic nucleotide-binding domain-containing protein [Bradyrhizobium zhanjiangense]